MPYERLTSDNAAVLFIDHQTGLANGVQTQSTPEFINNVRALVRIADDPSRRCHVLCTGLGVSCWVATTETLSLWEPFREFTGRGTP